jgi:hypothetical protein
MCQVAFTLAISMAQKSCLHRDIVAFISLQSNRRRLAGRGPGKAPQAPRGRPAGRLAAPCKNALMLSLPASTLSCLQFNDIGISFTQSQTTIQTLPGFRAGVTRRGDGGPLQAVAAPLTPRPRGTIYEALPFISWKCL